MEPTISVAELCAEQGIDHKRLADQAGLDARRVLAIVEGRWTPSPTERERIAAVFSRHQDEITWGHKNPIAHIQGHGPQFGRTP